MDYRRDGREEQVHAMNGKFHDPQESAQHSDHQVVVGQAILVLAFACWVCRLELRATYKADHTMGAVYAR